MINAVRPEPAVEPPSSNPSAAGRSRAIDGLRGVAILLVLGCHFVVPPDAAGFLQPVAAAWYGVGWGGVDLFFVLSGFLVSGLLFAEFKRNQRVDVGRFLVRRGFKIWPGYLCYITLIAAWLAWQQAQGKNFWDAAAMWPNFLHVQNYFGTPRVHTWSLAVEEHFYLVGALLAALLLVPGRRIVPGLFPAVALAGIAAVAVARHLGYQAGGPAALNLFATHLRFDGLLVGSLLAYFAHFEPRWLRGCRRHAVACLCAGAALALPVLVLTPNHSALVAGAGLTVMYAGFGLVVLGVVSREEQRNGRGGSLASPGPGWLARMGFFSYGIYLWHVDLAQTPFRKGAAYLAAAGWPDWAVWLGATAGYVAFAALMGAVMSRAIEIPFLKLRDRIFPSKVPDGRPRQPAESEGQKVPTDSTAVATAVAG